MTLNKRSWNALTAILLVSFLGGGYFLFARFDYSWTWSKVPQYFWSVADEDIFAPEAGEVLIDEKSPTVVKLQSEQELLSFDIPTSSQLVKNGERIFAGDKLGSIHQSRPGPLLEGLWMTLKLSFASTLLGLILGLISGLMKNSRHPILHYPAHIYIELIRGTPLLVQLFIIYFVFGTVVGLEDRFLCGVLSLGLFSGAYAGEIIRAGIQNVHFGQMEAARALGLTHVQAMSLVILPQVFKDILPSLSGVFISLIKDSSLVSVMALTDLTKAGREIVSSSFMVFEIWITVALLYFCLTYSLSYLVARLEKKLRKGERAGVHK